MCPCCGRSGGDTKRSSPAVHTQCMRGGMGAVHVPNPPKDADSPQRNARAGASTHEDSRNAAPCFPPPGREQDACDAQQHVRRGKAHEARAGVPWGRRAQGSEPGARDLPACRSDPSARCRRRPRRPPGAVGQRETRYTSSLLVLKTAAPSVSTRCCGRPAPLALPSPPTPARRPRSGSAVQERTHNKKGPFISYHAK